MKVANVRSDSYVHFEKEGYKICSWCGKEKLLNEFWKDKGGRHGRDAYCKTCRSDREKIRYSKDRVEILRKHKEYRRRNAEEIKNKKQKIHRFNTYGITEEEYFLILKKQNYKCPICDIKLDLSRTKSMKKACIDHCHKTLKNRGILCNLCNVGLGSFKDSKEHLFKAIEYLKEYD